MWAGMECLVVPRQLGWTDVGTWTRLERVLARPAGAPPSARPCSSTPRTPSSPAWTDDPSSPSAPAGLIVVTHEDAVYVLDKKKALDTGTLERLRSLLAASTREDLL